MNETRERWTDVLTWERLQPYRTPTWTKRDALVYRAGILNTLWLMRNNLKQRHYNARNEVCGGPDASDFETALYQIISKLEEEA